MAEVQKITLIDDLTGGVADREFTFTVEGVTHRLDLSEDSINRFYRAIDPWVTAAVRAKQHPQAVLTRPIPVARVDRHQVAAVRAWAKRQGMTLPKRGVTTEVMDAFQSAHARTAAG